jgi:hypothetical protein
MLSEDNKYTGIKKYVYLRNIIEKLHDPVLPRIQFIMLFLLFRLDLF